MKKIIFLAILFIIIFSIPSLGALAQENAENTTNSASSEGVNSIREKVQEKIEQVRNNPKAYLGTVTDITEKTVQIKGASEEILQISIDEKETIFVNIGKVTTTVSFEDIAIGDYIIAMGFKNGNEVLSARRILITTPPEAPARKILAGKVKEIEGKTLYLIDKNQKEYSLEFPKRWKGPEIDELEKGKSVILVSKNIEGKLTIRTIEILLNTESSTTKDEE